MHHFEWILKIFWSPAEKLTISLVIKIDFSTEKMTVTDKKRHSQTDYYFHNWKMVVSLVENLVSTPKIGFWPRNWSSWCVLQRSFGLNLPVEDFTRFYKTYVLAVDQTWCDLDIFGWIRSAWCWFDLISHPPNFIFAAFNMFGEFNIFDFFESFLFLEFHQRRTNGFSKI